MEKFPFTSYDFWAYLSAGFMLLFAIDQAGSTHLLMRDNWTLAQSIVAVSVAYVIGQLVASASSFIFEKLLVGKVLDYPTNILFEQSVARLWVQRLLPSYFKALPESTQKAALERGKKAGVGKPGEALFWPAYTLGKATPSVATRLDNFLNLYGFCRNAAFVAFADSAVLYWSYLQPKGPADHLLWSRLALVIGIGMLLRYLKFYRHFAVEVFTNFAWTTEGNNS